MAFDSASFIFVFFPLTLSLFLLAVRWYPRAAAPVLLAASLLFYAICELRSLPLLALSVVTNYGLVRGIARFERYRGTLISLGVIANLLPLVWFKYIGDSVVALHGPGAFAVAALPLGLSFYTFQQITALFDARKPDLPPLTLGRYALFAGFFAQIHAGPISRYRDLAPQIRTLGDRAVSATGIAAGSSLFAFGLAKKNILADNLGVIVDAVHHALQAGAPITQLEAWLAIWGFMLQLYFDFSGYSDMAIGAAMCFGIVLPPNFNSPLQATSGSAFVDRWHISLVSFVREFVYQPLFLSIRKRATGSSQQRRVVAWIVATITSMGLLGAWHGSRLTLLLGGLACGILLVASQLPTLLGRRVRTPRPVAAWRRTLTARLRQGLILVVLSLTGLINRAEGFDSILALLRSSVDPKAISLSVGMKPWVPEFAQEWLRFDGMLPHVPMVGSLVGPLVLIATGIVLLAPNSMQIFGLLPHRGNWPLQWRPTRAWGVAIGLMILSVIVFEPGSAGKFIYAGF